MTALSSPRPGEPGAARITEPPNHHESIKEMNGLIIREPWISHILSGVKTGEMRTTPTRYRGPIGLIGKGTGMVVGVADLVDSLPLLDAAGLAATHDRHRIPADLNAEVIQAGWLYPWVIRHARRLTKPISARQKPGQVIWVPLSPAVIQAIEAEMVSEVTQ